MQYSPFHLPVTSLGASPFHSPRVTIFGRRTIGPEIHRIPGCLSLTLFFWNYSAYIKHRLLTFSKPLKFYFWYLFPCCPGIKSVVLGMCIPGHTQEFLRLVWFLFQRCLPLPWYFLRWFLVQHLCSVLLVRSSFLVVFHYIWQNGLCHRRILSWSVFYRCYWDRICCSSSVLWIEVPISRYQFRWN